jgi:hypothetical protein
LSIISDPLSALEGANGRGPSLQKKKKKNSLND